MWSASAAAGRDPLPLIDAEEEEEEDEADTLEKKERRSDAQTLAMASQVAGAL